MDNDSPHTHQQAKGHHIAQADQGSTAMVGEEIHVHLPQKSGVTWQDIVIVGLGISALLQATASWLSKLKPEKRHAIGFSPTHQIRSSSEGVKLLRRHLPRKQIADADIESLIRDLEHHPLTLDLAGCYLKQIPRLAVNDYLKQLKEIRDLLPIDKWHDRMGSSVGHELDVVAAFVLSWEQVKGDPARRIFLLAGYCAPNQPIPHILLQQAAELDRVKIYEKALDMLVGLGLLEIDDADLGPLIHPLLAECAKSLVLEVPVPLFRLVNTLSALTNETSNVSLSDRFAALCPHIEAVAITAQDLGLEKAGTLWSNLGFHLRAEGDYAGALNAFERAGIALRDVGNVSQAAVCFREALKIDRQFCGPDHPNFTRSLNNLAMALRDVGSYPNLARDLGSIGTVLRDPWNLAQARELLEEALKYDSQFQEPDQPNIARDLSNLGTVLRDMGNSRKALILFERAWEIDRHLDKCLYGSDHLNVAHDLDNRGAVLHDLGKAAQARGDRERAQSDLAHARKLFEQSLVIWRKVHGEEHPQIATALTNLGMILQDQKDWNAACEALDQALAIWRTVYGQGHPQIAEVHSKLGNLRRDMEDLNGVRRAFERAIAIVETAYGKGHPHVAVVHTNLGIALQDLENLDSAQRAFEQALGILRAAYGEEHPQVAITHNNIGMVLQDLGDLDGAQNAYEQALHLLEKSAPSDHPYLSVVEYNLSNLQDGILAE